MRNLTTVNTKLSFSAILIALSLIFTSCGKSKSKLEIPGVKGPNVSLVGDNVLVDIVMENVHIEGGARYSIPQYNNSYLEVSPDLESDGTLLAFSVSLDDIFGDNVQRLDPKTLPGGRAIPGVSSGTLPAVAFSVDS